MEQKRFINVFLSLGSNQGDRMKTIQLAEQLIDRRVGRIAKKSAYYETAAWGKTDQPAFINCILMVNTTLSAKELLEVNQKVERELGREITGERWGPRLIDLDIIFYGKRVIRERGLDIPHPEMHKRLFVIIPMMEIAPEVIHPLIKVDMVTLYQQCEDQSDVIKIDIPKVRKPVVPASQDRGGQAPLFDDQIIPPKPRITMPSDKSRARSPKKVKPEVVKEKTFDKGPKQKSKSRSGPLPKSATAQRSVPKNKPPKV
jgi:2-amino-4-hydroxy-6-hydroxymethyldihydropteridine diphosphokinase